MRYTDPYDIIKYDRTLEELQENLLFCVAVAGKTAKQQVKALHDFLNPVDLPFQMPFNVYDSEQLNQWLLDHLRHLDYPPFNKIRNMIAETTLSERIKRSKLGQHNRLEKCFTELANSDIDLFTCTVEELEAIHGIGPKTARFFISNNRKDARVAMLDTHILRFMREELQIDSPKSTPSGKLYQELEQQYLAFADSIQRHPSELDLAIWKSYSLKNPGILYDFVFLKKSHNLAMV